MAGTTLADPAARKALVEGGPAAIAASADPLIELARRVEPIIRELRAWQEGTIQSVESRAGQKIAEARFAVYGKTAYPDANFNLRLEYGTVLGYEEDTTLVPYKTTFYGLYERAAAFGEKPPFTLPARWRDGRATLDLATPFNFVYTADTIGGNSGSPVINRNAEICGINFDSNVQKLPNRYLYIDEAEGLARRRRPLGRHHRGPAEALRRRRARRRVDSARSLNGAAGASAPGRTVEVSDEQRQRGRTAIRQGPPAGVPRLQAHAVLHARVPAEHARRHLLQLRLGEQGRPDVHL